MESKMPNPRNQKESKTKNSLLPHVLESIKKSIGQYENGQHISLEEFKKRHFIDGQSNTR